LLDLLIGAATMVAEANGIIKAGHVRSRLTELVSYTETVQGF
jgi:aromatic ring hydroxylase